MYEVRNECGTVMKVDGKANWQFLSHAKELAEELCNNSDRLQHYYIFKVEQVWSTSTLDEAMKR